MNSKLFLVSNKEDIDLLNVFLKTGEIFDTPIFRELSAYDVIIDEDNDEDMLLEYKMKQYLFNNNRLEITIIPGQKCNFNCTYCYEADNPKTISWDTLEGIRCLIQNLVFEHRYCEVRIFWFGGEPTLYQETIISFMDSLKRELPNTIISGSMTTNGYLLDVNSFVDYLNCGIDSFQITLDGFERTHDSQRHLKNGSGTWNRIIQNLFNIQKLSESFTIIVRVNYNEHMIDSIFDFMDFISDKFDNRFIVHTHPIFNGNPGLPFSKEMCDPEIERYIRMAIIDHVTNNDIKTDLPIILTSFGSQICYASRPNSFVVDENGIIRKCTVALDRDYNEIGRITSKDGYIINLYKMAEWTEARIQSEECNNCECIPACYRVGGCPKNFFEGSPNCSLNRHVTRYFIRRLASHLYDKMNISDIERNNPSNCLKC